MIDQDLEEVRIKKIGVLSFVNIFVIIQVIFGLLVGLIFVITAIFFPIINSKNLGILPMSSYWPIISFPIIFGIFGFVIGIILVLLYNLTSRFAGGIKLYS